MIGDTWFDTKGARLCGVDFVGVEYGYGDLESMKKEGGRVFVKQRQNSWMFLQSK